MGTKSYNDQKNLFYSNIFSFLLVAFAVIAGARTYAQNLGAGNKATQDGGYLTEKGTFWGPVIVGEGSLSKEMDYWRAKKCCVGPRPAQGANDAPKNCPYDGKAYGLPTLEEAYELRDEFEKNGVYSHSPADFANHSFWINNPNDDGPLEVSGVATIFNGSWEPVSPSGFRGANAFKGGASVRCTRRKPKIDQQPSQTGKTVDYLEKTGMFWPKYAIVWGPVIQRKDGTILEKMDYLSAKTCCEGPQPTGVDAPKNCPYGNYGSHLPTYSEAFVFMKELGFPMKYGPGLAGFSFWTSEVYEVYGTPRGWALLGSPNPVFPKGFVPGNLEEMRAETLCVRNQWL
jgi:hypothetical protein